MEELYKKIVETVPVFFFLWSCDKKETVFISEKFYDQRSHDYYDPEEPREDLRQYIDQESQESYDQFFDNLSEENHFSGEIEFRASDNLPNIKWMKLSTFPVIDDGKEINYIAGHISDITHTKEQSKFLEDQVESLDTVAFMLAHELSAPIANIMGLTEVLKSRAAQTDEVEYLPLYDSIYNFSGEVLTLARGMVSLLDLQTYKKQFPVESISLNPFIDELIRDFYLKPNTKKIILSTAEVAADVDLNVHSEKFGKAIEELLVYLLKHIKPNSQILFSTPPVQPQEEVILHITSQYVDLPIESTKQVLSRSSRLNMLDVRGRKMHGLLELVIAKEIIELHQGRLTLCDDTTAQGFKITLPQARQA
uniref:histidine kinase n=1 Tax=Roseihalotalea indica TaxID=2867963 RepID=A0AA49GQ83_9BACT|nr:hypothetical protein K4G66_09555 [Tunicatimonas sp. TK19036]